jgi:hypothetical protein
MKQAHAEFTAKLTCVLLRLAACRVGCIFPVNISMLLAFRALQGVARELQQQPATCMVPCR